MNKLLKTLQKDYPKINFEAGETFLWSSRKQTVHYPTTLGDSATAVWSLLHEMGHALLGHTTYQSDFELVKLEAAAWDKAARLGKKYGHVIDTDHIQDCIDTYREWLHQRSTCPKCLITSLQSDMHTYCCYNCNALWRVSRTKLCRPYRLLQKETASL